MGNGSRQLPGRRNAVGVRESGLYLAVPLFAFTGVLFRALAFGQIKNIGHALIRLSVECRCADQDRYPTSVFPEKFLFASLHHAGRR